MNTIDISNANMTDADATAEKKPAVVEPTRADAGAAGPEEPVGSACEAELTASELAQYRSDLGSVRFSQGTKDRMAARLAVAAEEERSRQHGEAMQAPESASEAPGRVARLAPASHARAGTSRRPSRVLWFRRWAVPLPLAAAVATLALVLTAGGVAYATGGYLSVGQFVSHLFGAGEAEVEVVEHIGRPVGVSATSNGVTITADAIIGDATNVAVVFSIARDDGEPFDIKPLENGLLSASFAEHIDVDFPLFTSWGGTRESYLYDEDPDDNSIQLVEVCSYESDGAGELSIVGRTMSVHLSDLTRYDENFGEVIAEGDWRLEFPLAYEDATRKLSAGQEMEVNGVAATIDELSVSPIAVHVAYTAQASADWAGPDADGRASEHDRQMSDTLLGLTGTLNLKDGTQVELDARSGGRMSEHGDTTECETNIILDRIVSLDDVASITLGGTTIEL